MSLFNGFLHRTLRIYRCNAHGFCSDCSSFCFDRSSWNIFRLCKTTNWNTALFGYFENLIKMLPNKNHRIYVFVTVVCLFVFISSRLLPCSSFHSSESNCICNFSHNIRFDMDIKIEITIHFIKTAMPCTWIIMHCDWNWNWNSLLFAAACRMPALLLIQPP